MKRSLLLCLVAFTAWADPVVLKVSSLAPRESPWGSVLRVWVKAVKEKTHGDVQIDMYWNGSQGDESVQMSKMKTGQLDGAIVTAVGLSIIDSNVNVFQLPGAYRDWKDLDQVREALKPRFEKTFRAAGFELVGWGDVGLDRWVSKGFPVAEPNDIKSHRPWVWKDDPVLPAVFQSIGVVPTATAITESLPELSAGHTNVLSASALACEQFQLSSHLDHVSMMVVAPNIGGMVLSKAKLDSLKPEYRAIVIETGRLAAQALTDKIRAEDAKAFERLSARMTVVQATDSQLAQWKKVFTQARSQLTKTTFAPEVIAEVEKLQASK